jgi:hypothetical protein
MSEQSAVSVKSSSVIEDVPAADHVEVVSVTPGARAPITAISILANYLRRMMMEQLGRLC